jgi:hypothetical protein
VKRGIHHLASIDRMVEQASAVRLQAEANAYAAGRWDERALFGPSPLPAPSEFVRAVLARGTQLVGFRELWDEMAAALAEQPDRTYLTPPTETLVKEGTNG